MAEVSTPPIEEKAGRGLDTSAASLFGSDSGPHSSVTSRSRTHEAAVVSNQRSAFACLLR